MGRIKSLPRIINSKNSYVTKERILKNIENSKGYLRVELKINRKAKRFFVHRLVAEHFINQPKGYNIVNHLDCNPRNNNAENLEWTTMKGNTEYMQKLGRNKRNKQWIDRLKETQSKKAKKIMGISINDSEVLKYDALNDVKKDGFQPSCVSNCCNGKRLTHKGYVWKFTS